MPEFETQFLMLIVVTFSVRKRNSKFYLL